MKRQDAFRKLRTICERLDQVDPETFFVRPLRLYLFGSVLTDKPDPKDVDLILVYGDRPDLDEAETLRIVLQHEPTPVERAVIHLRRRLQQIRVAVARGSLANWANRDFLLDISPGLIWQPGADWAARLSRLEAEPLPWAGPRAPDADEKFTTWVENLPEATHEAQLSQALAAIEGQTLPGRLGESASRERESR